MLSALEIIAHFDPLDVGHREPGHRAAEDPPVHGAPALGGRDLLQVRNSVQEADAAVDQHALEAEAKPVQAREAWQDGRHLRAAQRGPRLMEGQYERVSQSREALQRSCCTVRGDCARGHGGACGAAEHSGLGFLQWKMPIFPCFCMFFGRCQPKMAQRGTPRLFSRFLGALKSGVTLHQK